MKDEMMENWLSPGINRDRVTQEQMSMGSLSGKYPVPLSDGRTVVYISDKSKEAKIRLKYESLRDKKIPTRNPRHHK